MTAAQRQPTAEPRSMPTRARSERRVITLGVLLAGRRTREIAARAIEELEHRLNHAYPSVRWEVAIRRQHERPVPQEISQLLDWARERLLTEGWTLALVITDLPLRSAGRPISSHASRTHGVGIISLPALGPVQIRRRLIRSALAVVASLIGERPANLRRRTLRARRTGAATRRRLRELASPRRRDLETRFFAVRTLRARARLLAGMVVANRPWRLAAGLYRGLVAALAFICFSVVSPGTWQLAVSLGFVRLALATVAALAIMVSSLIVVHRLWEHSENPLARDQVLLFNAATAFTLIAGVLTFYVALLAATFLAAIALIPAGVLGTTVHRPAGLAEYLQLAWLISSLATVGGALGAALESDAAVREATYASDETTENPVIDTVAEVAGGSSHEVADDAPPA
jgi:hypothetical protein